MAGGGPKVVEEYDRETTFSPTNSSKEHLNAEQIPQNTGRGHQAPRKAAHSLQKEVGQNIRQKETKELGTTWRGSREGGKVSKQQETLSQSGLWGVWGSQRAT